MKKEKKVRRDILATLRSLGYTWEIKGEIISARRRNAHMLLRVTKSGKIKNISAHIDRPISIGALTLHKAVKNVEAELLIKEFKDAYRRIRGDVSQQMEKIS